MNPNFQRKQKVNRGTNDFDSRNFERVIFIAKKKPNIPIHKPYFSPLLSDSLYTNERPCAFDLTCNVNSHKLTKIMFNPLLAKQEEKNVSFVDQSISMSYVPIFSVLVGCVCSAIMPERDE